MKSKILYLLLLINAMAFAQGRKTLKGQVMSGETPLAGVFVINNKTGDETKTDSRGKFSIKARSGDAIAVYGNTTELREFDVTDETFKESPYIISVDYKAYELDEVVVDKDDPYSLGQKGKKAAHTPAERKAVAGARIGPRFNDPTVQGAAINGDGIINAVTGKRKEIKRRVETEKKEKLITAFKGIFDDETLTSEYSIPKENIEGFTYYCIDDRKMAKALETNNTEDARALLPDLSLKYLEVLRNEK